MNILYTGPCRSGSLTDLRRRSLIRIGHQVDTLDQVPYLDRGARWQRKVQSHLLIGRGVSVYNRDLVERARTTQPEMVYVDQAIYLWPSTVKALRDGPWRLVHYTSEFFGFRKYLYRHLFPAVPLYDAHVITNELNEPVLKTLGARQVCYTQFGFDAEHHQPPEWAQGERDAYASDVTFVGHWEETTERRIAALRRAGVQVRVWGPGWRQAKLLDDRHTIRPLYGSHYVKAIAAARICLGLLSKWNFNRSASRTFEIPAIGSMLVAERTTDHERSFVDGHEAVFFDDDETLVEKVQYYLAHEDERQKIAAAGRARCHRDGYSHDDRVRQLLEAIA